MQSRAWRQNAKRSRKPRQSGSRPVPILELLDATRSRFDLENTRIDLVANLVDSQSNFLAIRGNLENRIGLPAAESAKR
jgi:hypothetical protein